MLLLIPGPVTTRPEVRNALTRDIAPWDNDFRVFMARLRRGILRLAGGDTSELTTLPLQGCGHFVTEAALRSFLPPGGRILVPATGAYANRMIRLAREAGRVAVTLPMGLAARTDPAAVARAWPRTRACRMRCGLLRNRQRHGPRCAGRRRRVAGGGAADDHRCSLRFRRAAAGPVGPAGGRCRRLHLQQMPGGAPRDGLCRRQDRPSAGQRREGRKLVVRSVRTSTTRP